MVNVVKIPVSQAVRCLPRAMLSPTKVVGLRVQRKDLGFIIVFAIHQ